MTGVYESFSWVFKKVLRVDPREIRMGSWIDGVPLPLSLLANDVLTVDLSPALLLDPEANYGCSLRTLAELAHRGFVVFNFRDWDSDGRAEPRAGIGGAEQGKEPFGDHRKVADEIEYLFSRRPRIGFYFGSLLRRQVFDPLLRESGGRRVETGDDVMRDAADRLRPAFEFYQAVDGTGHPDWRLVEPFLFRGRTTSLEAVAWHKAFLKAVRGSLPSNVRERIEKLFAICQRDPSAAAFARLAGFLRDCHLRFTAPGTAAFGGTYNIRADEFERTSAILDYDLNERLPEERWVRTDPGVLDFAYRKALRNWARGDAKLQALAMLQEEEAPHADVKALLDDRFMEVFIEYLEVRRQSGGGQLEALRELQRASRDHADARRLRRHLADLYEEKRLDYERWRRVMSKASSHLEWGLQQAENYGEENLRATLHDTSVVKPVADMVRVGALAAEVAVLKMIERWKGVTELDRRVWKLNGTMARPG